MPQSIAEALAAAFEHHRAGNLAQAEPLYRQILEQDPGAADAWHLLGVLCLQSNRDAEAIEMIGRAIDIRADNADYFSHLGAAHSKFGQHEQAVESLRRAVQLAPRLAGVHYNLGTALRNAGRLEEAVASFRHAVAADPNAAEAHYNLANTLGETHRPDEAEASYRAALRARPGYVKAMVNLGNLLRDQARYAEAIEVLTAALAIDGRHASAQMNLGVVLRDAGQHEQAVRALERAVELDPTSAEAHNNLGTALQSQARFLEALACYEEALRLDPQLADAHFSRATYRMRQGDLAGGFAEYEWRWKCKRFSTRRFERPRWDGSPLEGRTILLHAEQGLGDTLQFIRYAADVIQRGGKVAVECQKPLLAILSGCAGIDRLLAAGDDLPSFDVECPLLSLPGTLGLSIEELWRGPYLAADPRLVERWGEVLAAYPGYRVGVCWQGNPKHLFDAQRSFPLARLEGVAQVPGVRLISLQKGPGCEQIAGSRCEVVDLGKLLDEQNGAFMDTAAVIQHLNLVITCDTAVAHLAGALGTKVWLALSAHGDWRWMAGRDDSPWYPTLRLFRQRRLNDWPDVFDRMAAELPKLVDGR